MQQTPLFRAGHHRDGIRGPGSAEVGAFERVDRDIDLGIVIDIVSVGPMTHTHLLSDIQHWGIVTFAFSNHDLPAHWNAVHDFSHCLNCHMIRILPIALPHCLGGGNPRCFNHSQEIESELVLHLSFSHYYSSSIIRARLDKIMLPKIGYCAGSPR